MLEIVKMTEDYNGRSAEWWSKTGRSRDSTLGLNYHNFPGLSTVSNSDRRTDEWLGFWLTFQELTVESFLFAVISSVSPALAKVMVRETQRR
jgi:hypothetical protein